MAKAKPLWVRLYGHPAYIELARIVGYQELSIKDVQEKAKALGEQYGKQKVQAAADEILHFNHQAGTVRLNDVARKLCFQLLGAPPDHPEYEHSKSKEAWIPPWARAPRPPEETKPTPKKRTKKKGATDGSPSDLGPTGDSG